MGFARHRKKAKSGEEWTLAQDIDVILFVVVAIPIVLIFLSFGH